MAFHDFIVHVIRVHLVILIPLSLVQMVLAFRFKKLPLRFPFPILFGIISLYLLIRGIAASSGFIFTLAGLGASYFAFSLLGAILGLFIRKYVPRKHM